MSSTTTPLQTADQPALHPSNITAHPGSTWAGAGVLMAAVATQISSGSMPTTTAGWITFVLQILLAAAAALGK